MPPCSVLCGSSHTSLDNVSKINEIRQEGFYSQPANTTVASLTVMLKGGGRKGGGKRESGGGGEREREWGESREGE